MISPINSCLVSILVYLGFLTLGWLPLLIYKQISQQRRETSHILLKRLGQLFLASCVVIALYQMTTWALIRYQLEDRGVIDANYRDFRDALAEEHYEEAYLYMSPDYREANSQHDFQTWVGGNYFPEEVPDRYLRISLFSNTAELLPEYSVYGEFFQNTVTLSWVKVDGEWYLTGKIGYILD